MMLETAPRAWTPFEHAVFRELTAQKIIGKKIIIAISGGKDSVGLLSAMKATERACRNSLLAIYVDHGASGLLVTQEYRQAAKSFCERLCAHLNIPFSAETAPIDRELKSEAELREHRYHVLQRARLKYNADYIATAHHADDLLETRMLRLIRGTSVEGLPAILPVRGYLLRPLLKVSSLEISSYVSQSRLSWMEDPSNKDPKYLRNWLRHQWLPELEARQPGALKSLARSLENLAQEQKFSAKKAFCRLKRQKGLHQAEFLELSAKKQMQVLAYYLRSIQKPKFTQNHLKEIIKHLDISKKKHRFICADCVWHINAGQFWAEPGHESLST